MNKKFLITLGIISFTAFLIRFQVCRELNSIDPQVAHPSSVTDMFTYKDLSEKIIRGKFDKVFYYQPFYYAVFLPAVKFCFGNGIYAVIFFQCLLSALTVWLAGLAGAMLKNRITGISAATLITFSTIMILFTPYYLIATLQAFWVTLILYLSIRMIRKRSEKPESREKRFYIETATLGVVTGAAILTRGNIWIFVPGIAVMLILISGTENRKSISIIALTIFTLAVIIPQIPFVIHNSKITGKLTPPSTAAGAVLALGNTPETPPGGRDPGTGAGPMEYPDTCKYWGKEAGKTSVYKQMLAWFLREPAAFMELQFRKMLLFWDYREIPNNIAIETQGVRSPTLRLLGFLPVSSMATPNGTRLFLDNNLVPMSFLILLLGLSGTIWTICRFIRCTGKHFIKNLQKNLPEYILAYFIIAYWLGTALFYILGRFRVPLIPLLAVSGALLLYRIYAFIARERRNRNCEVRKNINKRVIIYLFIVLCTAFFTVAFGYTTYRYTLESKVIAAVRPQGVITRVGKTSRKICDNGPASFGSWTPLKLQEGAVIKKRYATLPGRAVNTPVTFKLELYWHIPGNAALNINGRDFKITGKRPGRKSATFELNNISENEVVITPENIDGAVFIFIDRQRDYGRTEVAGKSPGGELVSAIYEKVSDKK